MIGIVKKGRINGYPIFKKANLAKVSFMGTNLKPLYVNKVVDTLEGRIYMFDLNKDKEAINLKVPINVPDSN